MPGWLKTVLATLGALLVLGFLAVRYLNSHKEEWRKSHNEAFQAARDEGERFAVGKDESPCVDEGVRRVVACGDFALGCEGEARFFLRGCLSKAAAAPSVCADVPPRDEILASAKWALVGCVRRGASGSQSCGRLMGEVRKHCLAARGAPR